MSRECCIGLRLGHWCFMIHINNTGVLNGDS